MFDDKPWSRTIANKCSGPLVMVPKNRKQMLGTVGNGPEQLTTNVRDRWQWSRRFVDQENIWMKIDPFCNGRGHAKIKGKIDKKA